MSRPRLLGLTGSIGMGKSTTAALFREKGVPVWDADAAVHALYAEGGGAVRPLAALCPEAVRHGAVDRHALKAWIAREPEALMRIEAVVHPLVAADRQAFIDRHQNAPLLVLDIPLLFETGADKWLDAVLVVTAAPEVQRARVLDRPGMTEAQLDAILARQMPDAEKRARADHVIETLTPDHAGAEVAALIESLGTANA
ncbi:dephospho-CoA kinase [Rhodovulum sulfidophilum]|uniref:Dephospho-CoA kinase n=1 Tax=Rhodovulum sulfidophilum TaxID=35806 RepID=A0A0D6B829_RHOSU|nr:dephospho-CoA kinase [Rhodovulum sulfidophilum]